MLKNKFFICVVAMALFVSACSTKNELINPLARAYGDKNDTDPLKIGKNPTMPLTQLQPALINGENLVPKLSSTPPPLQASNKKTTKPQMPKLQSSNSPFLTSAVIESQSYVSDFVSIMGAGGGVLTVWALARGNWIWGYTLVDSISFGDARIWQFIEFNSEYVMIKNAKTLTCLNAYGNGIIHQTCDQSNPMQFWKLIPMSNQAVQIQNVQTKKCIQAPISDILGGFHEVFSIYQTDCVKPKQKNFDQQWYIIAPPVATNPLYTIN